MSKPKILVACERSGIVRDAFRRAGWEAWSCDLHKSMVQGHHLQFDVTDVLHLGWDMMIAFPPCQYVTYAGAVHWKKPRWKDKQQQALSLFYILLNAPIERICIENPRGLPSKLIRKPDDKIQPYEFGHHVSKATYLWLKNLPPLMKTHIDPDFEKDWVSKQHGFDRSITFSGIAEAMAKQWGAGK